MHRDLVGRQPAFVAGYSQATYDDHDQPEYKMDQKRASVFHSYIIVFSAVLIFFNSLQAAFGGLCP
jgi:hypothetical protein